MALPLRSLQRLRNSLKICSLKYKMTPLLYPDTNFKLNNFLRSCTMEKCYEDKDPAPLFFDSNVQDILKKLTGCNIEKVFKNRHLENPDVGEEYKFLTKEDMEERVDKSMKEASRLLQMPPVMREREPITEVLSYDPAIQGSEDSKIVITDITYGVSDRTRIIVVREPDGTLRQAMWEERDRMNYIYNPRPGRYYKVPPAFQDENLKDVLDRGEYTFILDFACAHFEPDDPLYHKVTRETYEHIRNSSKYDELYSTRHYGPMCFYFVWNKKIDNHLLHYIREERLEEAVDLIQLHYMIHDKEKIGAEKEKQNHLDFITKYVKEDSVMKSNLLSALELYQETLRERENLEKTVKTSHGIS